jgi:hypothetical protein
VQLLRNGRHMQSHGKHPQIPRVDPSKLCRVARSKPCSIPSFIVHCNLHLHCNLPMAKEGESTNNDSAHFDEKADRALVYHLGTGEDLKFLDFCNRNNTLFGPEGSSKRRYWQHRRNYIAKKQPHRLRALFIKYFPQFYAISIFAESSSDQFSSPATYFSSPRPTPDCVSSSTSAKKSNSFSPSPIQPRRIMSPSNNVFQLFYSTISPEKNPKGIIVVKKDGAKSGDSLVSQLTIYFTEMDANDASAIELRLSPSGDRILLRDNTQPSSLVDDLQALHFYTAEGSDDEQDEAFSNQMSVIQTKINRMKKNGGFKTDFEYIFPDGITCNSDHFNSGKGSQLDVVPKMSLVPYNLKGALSDKTPPPSIPVVDDDEQMQGAAAATTTDDAENMHVFPAIRVRLAIDETAEDLKDSDEKTKLHDSMSALKERMERMKLKKGLGK